MLHMHKTGHESQLGNMHPDRLPGSTCQQLQLTLWSGLWTDI